MWSHSRKIFLKGSLIAIGPKGPENPAGVHEDNIFLTFRDSGNFHLIFVTAGKFILS